MEEVRLFIAIELPDELRQELAKLESELKSGNQYGVKWVEPNGIHLTLKFLGNVLASQIADITRAMETAAQGVSPIHLNARRTGAFPNLKRVQVIWVGLEGEIDKLRQLQQRIESSLAPLGFVPEARPFTAHLTLARIRNEASPEQREKLGQLIASTKFEPTRPIEVDAISLLRSQLTRTGAIHTRIGLVKLMGK